MLFTSDVQGHTRFNGVSFGADAIFGGTREYLHGEWLGNRREGAVFHGLVEFVGAHFQGAARFDWAHFGKHVTFANARFESEFRHEEPDPAPAHERRVLWLARARFRVGLDVDLPAGEVHATGMDIGGASRLKIRGPVFLDHLSLAHPLTIITTNREEVAAYVSWTPRRSYGRSRGRPCKLR